MKHLKDSSGGEIKSSPRLRHFAIGLIVAIIAAVVLTAFGHARIHASASNTAQFDSSTHENQASPGVAFHTKVPARDEASRADTETKQPDSTVIVHGSIDGNIHPINSTPSWRHWLQ